MQRVPRAPMRAVRCTPVMAVLGASLLAITSARAEQDVLDPDLTASVHAARNGSVNLLPESIAARVGDERVTATTWAGYDGAKRAALFTTTVEARLVGRLVLMAGGGYTAEIPGSPGFRPQVGLRLQALDESRHGVDGSVAVLYRQDQFTDEGGFLQGALAIERRLGRLVLVGNMLYGQDGEGDDRNGAGRLAAMYAVHPAVLFGLDGRYSHELWSNDPKGAARTRPVSELVFGPTASVALGTWVVMAEAGFSSVRSPGTQNGAIALTGLGSSF